MEVQDLEQDLNQNQDLETDVTWQKLCPHGVETGSTKRSRQMEQVNSCSEKNSGAAASAMAAPFLYL